MKKILFVLAITLLLPIKGNTEVKLFNPFQHQEVRDLVFDVTSPNIDKLLHTKLMLPKKEEFRVRVYWHKGKKIESRIVTDISQVDQKLMKKVKDDLFNRIKSLMLSNIYESIAGYKKVKLKNNSFRYTDETGLYEIESAIIKERASEIEISLQRPGGDEQTKYKLKSFPWSKNQPVIYKVLKVNTNKLQKTEINTTISYKRFGQYWMPQSLTSKIEQNLRVSPVDKYKSERSLSEQLQFENYHINKNMALKWFAKQM